jgi:hypothetical protein
MPKGSRRRGDDVASLIQQAKVLLDEIARRIGAEDDASLEVKTSRPARVKNAVSQKAVDLSMPIRAFANRYARGLSGPKQFTLLVAYLSKGDPKTQVSRAEVEKAWSKLTGVLGKRFNPAHTTRARDNDWVHAEKTGAYTIRPSWKDALK